MKNIRFNIHFNILVISNIYDAQALPNNYKLQLLK
jgi:hypothetical protein